MQQHEGTALGDVATELAKRIDATPASQHPFPNLYIQDIFPQAFYASMLAHVPPRRFYTPISETERTAGGYDQRLILHLKKLDALPPELRHFWDGINSVMTGSGLASAVVKKFASVIAENSGADPRDLDYGAEAMLVKDLDGYAIGPHTDVRSRAVSIMFYLPPDDSYRQCGTTLYAPREPGFRSDGTSHLDVAEFEKVETMPCSPNAMFGFARSDVSFHGVEPIAMADVERDVLLYILRWKKPRA